MLYNVDSKATAVQAQCVSFDRNFLTIPRVQISIKVCYQQPKKCKCKCKCK